MDSENIQTSSWQKYTTKRLCDFCKKDFAVWIHISDFIVRCDKCVPRTMYKRSFLKEGIDPVWDEFGRMINLPDDFEQRYGVNFPNNHWEYFKDGFQLEENLQVILLKRFVNETNKCPQCCSELTGVDNSILNEFKKCPKCGWSSKEI